MIQPGDLHRYFKVSHIAAGLEFRIAALDTRYEVTGPGLGDYRPCPAGEYFLCYSRVLTHPWGAPMRLDEVEPLPDGAGMYHPDHISSAMQLRLAMTYEGSWRQYADRQRERAEGRAA